MAEVLLTVGLVALAFGIGLFTLIGDCPEHVISGWNGGTACSDQKRLIGRLILFGFPLLWLLGTVAIFRRRRR